MKTLTGVIALVLALLFGTSNGVIAAEQKSRPTGVEKKQPATGEIAGKVTGVDPAAKIFTVMFQGRAITFSAARLSKLPTVGETIDIAFTLRPDEMPIATSTTQLASTAREEKKYLHCRYRGSPLYSLNVCKDVD